MTQKWNRVLEELEALYEAFVEGEDHCNEVDALMEAYHKWMEDDAGTGPDR